MIWVLHGHEIITKSTVLDTALLSKDFYSPGSSLQLTLNIILEDRFIFTRPINFSVSVINITTKVNSGSKGFISSYRFLSMLKESQGGDLEVKPEAEVMNEYC